MTSLISIELCRPERFGPDDYAVFGGTFDPFHEGHARVTKSLTTLFQRVFVAPTATNPWKAERPTPLELRREMIRLVLEFDGISVSVGDPAPGTVVITSFPYVYAEELVRELRSTQRGTLYWAVGEDSAAQVHLWRNWDSLGVPSIVHPIIEPVHAADIRAGTHDVHPALADYVRTHGLYR